MKKYARKEFQLKEDSSQLYSALLFIQVIMSPVQNIALRPCTHSIGVLPYSSELLLEKGLHLLITGQFAQTASHVEEIDHGVIVQVTSEFAVRLALR